MFQASESLKTSHLKPETVGRYTARDLKLETRNSYLDGGTAVSTT